MAADADADTFMKLTIRGEGHLNTARRVHVG